MPDYGHDLELGVFITPSSRNPGEVVARAERAERVGLDLATFQDHPYNPGLLDTWTLLSWVAARTNRLRVSGNVLNLPLRQPAVLARAAASLDLLSGGRFELGLGAGAFLPAIEAMGGRRLSPGQAVDALGEAIDVIREIWDVSERGSVRVEGAHYHVRGAKRGPEPAHDISIWLGAYKPRMLRLTGAKADGWLPSLPYMKEGDLTRGNAAVDEGAVEAGREPREIRRLLNVSGTFQPTGAGFLQGPPEQWVEDLLALALEDGIGTFILMTDDPHTIEIWGEEVAPALRERVASERTSAGTLAGEVVRGASALALRHAGVDYDAVPRSLRRTAVEPGDRGYGRVRSTYMRSGSPGLVLRPGNPDEVAEALAFARDQDVPFAIRSGGHGISGRSTGDSDILVDLGRLDEITVLDPASGRIRLGPGARWGDVARALAPHGLAISSGDYGGVGVGGLATTAGIGFLARKHGLTIDHVLAAELILANGTFLRVDAEENPDLFWALRGAGGNFGIVTAFELAASSLGNVVFSTMLFDGGAVAPLLERWGEVVEAAPRELTSFLTAFARPHETPLVQLSNIYASDDTTAAMTALTPLLDIGRLLDQEANLLPYAAIVPPADNIHFGAQNPLVSGGLAVHLSPDLSDGLAVGIGSRVMPFLQIRSVGGAVNDITPDATAYAHRHQNFSVSSVGRSGSADAFSQSWDDLRPLLDGLYLSFETDERPQRLTDAFPPRTLARLRHLKALYDPDNLFNRNFPIPPALETSHETATPPRARRVA